MEDQMAETLLETTLAIAADESAVDTHLLQPRTGGYFSEAIHQGVVDRYQSKRNSSLYQIFS